MPVCSAQCFSECGSDRHGEVIVLLMTDAIGRAFDYKSGGQSARLLRLRSPTVRQLVRSLTAAATAVLALTAAQAAPPKPCLEASGKNNSVCHVLELGWAVSDVGPPVRFKPADGAQGIEIAISKPGRLTGDPAGWALSQLQGPAGTFGPFSSCHGTVAPGAKLAALDCSLPPDRGQARQGALVLVNNLGDYQVIGIAAPAGTDFAGFTRTRLAPLFKLITEGLAAGVGDWSARAALYGGREYYLAPGKGIPPDRIEGVYHHWDLMPTMNMGLMETGSDYVLFDNGEVWADPDVAPQDIDPAKAKQAVWSKWGFWRRTGSDIVLQMNGAKNEQRFAPSELIRYEPAGRDQLVEGSWHATLGGVSRIAGNSTSAVATNALILHEDGSFERSGFSSVGFAGETGNTRSGATAMSTRPTRSGHYRIDRYALTLDYADGQHESDLFYWAGGKDDRYGLLMLNGGKYLGGLKR